MKLASDGRMSSERKHTNGKVLDPLQRLTSRNLNSGGEDRLESKGDPFQSTNPIFNNKGNLQRSREANSRSMALEKGIFSEDKINFEISKKPPLDNLFKPAMNLKRGGDLQPAKLQESGIFKLQMNTSNLLNSTLSLNPKALLEKKEKLYLLDKPSNQGLINDGLDDDRILSINEVLNMDFFPIVNESVANSRNPQVFKKLFLQKISKTVKF